MARSNDKLVRTTITLPLSLKEKMARMHVNWSEELRQMIFQRLEEEGQPNMAEAVILNEQVRRNAPENWNSLEVIKHWRKRRVRKVTNS
jgi:hypothetical protein